MARPDQAGPALANIKEGNGPLVLTRYNMYPAAAINGKSPQAIRMLKYAFNLTDDGLVGQQLFAGEATRLAYMTDEAVEGRDAFLEKRDPDWARFPYYY
jgi:naphthoate synthase